jgi:hypothetical protein
MPGLVFPTWVDCGHLISVYPVRMPLFSGVDAGGMTGLILPILAHKAFWGEAFKLLGLSN